MRSRVFVACWTDLALPMRSLRSAKMRKNETGSGMNVVMKEEDEFICSCGARAKDNGTERGRFMRRHPKLCNARGDRKSVAKGLAQGVRIVASEENEIAAQRQQWDALENRLRAARGLPPMDY